MIKLLFTQNNNTWYSKPLLGHNSVYVANIVKINKTFIVSVIDINNHSIVESDLCGSYTAARSKSKQLLKQLGVKFQDIVRRTL